MRTAHNTTSRSFVSTTAATPFLSPESLRRVREKERERQRGVRDMAAWAKSLLVLVAIQVIATSLLPQGAVADDACSGVDCGQGSCEVSANSTYGFVCNCKAGWIQFHVEDYFRFLPCVVPNCTIDYTCYRNATWTWPPTSPSLSPPTNISVFDPCFGSYCGTGTCVKTGTYTHRCDCVQGFSNLLNVSSYPCFKDCALGADCAKKGITLNSTSSSSAPSPSLSESTSAAVPGGSPSVLMWLFILVITLASVRRM